MKKNIGNDPTRFLMGTIFLVIVIYKSDKLTNWINGPLSLGTNVAHLSGVHCTTETAIYTNWPHL